MARDISCNLVRYITIIWTLNQPPEIHRATQPSAEYHMVLRSKACGEGEGLKSPSHHQVLRRTTVGRNIQLLWKQKLVSLLVSWWFEPSQSQRITLKLDTNFTPSPTYSFYKSSYHKFFFLYLFIFRRHLSEPAISEQRPQTNSYEEKSMPSLKTFL